MSPVKKKYRPQVLKQERKFLKPEESIKLLPKGKSWERVPMPEMLADFLKSLKVSQKASDSDLVCPSENGVMLDYSVILRGVKNLCREAGVTIVTPHELRHSCTELYMQLGEASMEDIRRLLHHKSAQTTQRYIHRTDERLHWTARNLSNSILGKSKRGFGLHVVNSQMDT